MLLTLVDPRIINVEAEEGNLKRSSILPKMVATRMCRFEGSFLKQLFDFLPHFKRASTKFEEAIKILLPKSMRVRSFR